MYLDGGDELKGHIKSEFPELFPVQAFYIGEDKEKIKSKFKRVHECVRYEKVFGGF